MFDSRIDRFDAIYRADVDYDLGDKVSRQGDRKFTVEGIVYDGPNYDLEEPDYGYDHSEEELAALPEAERDRIIAESNELYAEYEMATQEWHGAAIRASVTIIKPDFSDESIANKTSSFEPYRQLFNSDNYFIKDHKTGDYQGCSRIFVINWVESAGRFKGDNLFNLLVENIIETFDIDCDAILINTAPVKPENPFDLSEGELSYWNLVITTHSRESGLDSYFEKHAFKESKDKSFRFRFLDKFHDFY
jgi:hypothetical protein